jgi:RNA polymerase sigma-70 factor (ECF subfamily)
MLDDIAEATGHFQPAWTTRAHLLMQLDRVNDAVVAFDKAISMTADPAERAHLQTRRARLGCRSRRRDLVAGG